MGYAVSKKIQFKYLLKLIIIISPYVFIFGVLGGTANLWRFKMMAFENQINEPARNITTLCYRRKGYRMTVFFVVWLVYSACVLGWSILNTPSGLRCTTHIL
jgi:hypothetical protein